MHIILGATGNVGSAVAQALLKRRESVIVVTATMIRAAYYMSNLDASLLAIRKQGMVQTLYPEDFKLLMVAPSDIGEFAAHLMTEPIEQTGLHFIEGPDRYSSQDVANAFAAALNRSICAESIPRDRWLVTMKSMGFSNEAAESFTNMTEATLDETFPALSSVKGGMTSLHDYILQLVQSSDPIS